MWHPLHCDLYLQLEAVVEPQFSPATRLERQTALRVCRKPAPLHFSASINPPVILTLPYEIVGNARVWVGLIDAELLYRTINDATDVNLTIRIHSSESRACLDFTTHF